MIGILLALMLGLDQSVETSSSPIYPVDRHESSNIEKPIDFYDGPPPIVVPPPERIDPPPQMPSRYRHEVAVEGRNNECWIAANRKRPVRCRFNWN